MSDPMTLEQKADERGELSVTAESSAEKNNTVDEVASHHPQKIEEYGNEPQPHLHAKTFLAVFAVCLIYFAQDFALVGAGAQGNTIAAHFGASSESSWITAPITIMTTVLSPFVCQASDYWGRKWFLVGLCLSGAVGCIIIGRASSMEMLIAGFAITGTAFGAQPLLHTVASEVLPRRWRSWGQACAMLANGLGLTSGLLIGGALNRHGDPNGFRYYFYIAMALFVIAAVVCVFTYQPLPTKQQTMYTFNEKLACLDWIGYGLLATSLVLFSVGLIYSKNPYNWSNPHVSATFAIGAFLFIVLAVYEFKFKKDGIFHHGLFTSNRNFRIAMICVFCEGIAFFAANIYLAYQAGVLYDTDVLIVGTRVAVGYIAGLVASFLTGLYCALTRQIRWATFVAFVLFALFFITMATTTKDSSQQVWGYPVFMGFGLGMTLVLLVTVAQLSTPPELIATASGLIISVRSLGGTIGIAIYNAVLTSATSKIPAKVASAAIKAGLPLTSVTDFVTDLLSENTAGLIKVEGVTPIIIGAGSDALLDTYALGFRNVWISALCFIVLAGIASLFLFDPKEQFTNHIDAPVEKDEELYSIEH